MANKNPRGRPKNKVPNKKAPDPLRLPGIVTRPKFGTSTPGATRVYANTRGTSMRMYGKYSDPIGKSARYPQSNQQHLSPLEGRSKDG